MEPNTPGCSVMRGIAGSRTRIKQNYGYEAMRYRNTAGNCLTIERLTDPEVIRNPTQLFKRWRFMDHNNQIALYHREFS